VKESTEFSSAFQLNLIGSVSSNVMDSIGSFGLENHIQNHGYVSHTDALEFQKNAQLLLLIEENSKETEYIIPGKLFEYMASKRPIIAIGPNTSDIEKIINQTNSGTYFRYDNEDLLRTTLRAHFEAFKTQQLRANSKGLEMYSRKFLTKQLAKKILT
ncbi:glycosyl transferase family 1, partial [Flavobacteriaceae bacterium]|nr:glycosyl transferase family 1 [Flavobacteriaceae bacterium]